MQQTSFGANRPDNYYSRQGKDNMNFPNKAGDHADTDDILRAELKAAGIPTLQEDAGEPPEKWATLLRSQSGEVKTSIRGSLCGWKFERGWYYWKCEGPGIEVGVAEELHAKFGKVVRVAGHCGCPSPIEWYKGLAVGDYHVDTPDGLKALADTIKMLANRVKTPEQYTIRVMSALKSVECSKKNKWNERFIDELKQRSLLISNQAEFSPRYPMGVCSAAPIAYPDNEVTWPQGSCIVWKLD